MAVAEIVAIAHLYVSSAMCNVNLWEFIFHLKKNVSNVYLRLDELDIEIFTSGVCSRPV